MTRDQKIQSLNARCYGNPFRMIEQAVDEIIVLTELLAASETRRLNNCRGKKK